MTINKPINNPPNNSRVTKEEFMALLYKAATTPKSQLINRTPLSKDNFDVVLKNAVKDYKAKYNIKDE